MTNASRHCEEFLDESKDFEDLSAPKRHALLRKARAVVMECLHTLKPPEARTPGATESSTPIEYDDNLKLHRAPIFEATTEQGGWSQGMLAAIATAQKMGATNFEIYIKSEKVTAVRQQHLSMYEMLTGNPTESWMQGATMAWRVIIYAVTVK